MKKYIAAKEALFDDDKKLFGAYIGIDTPGKPLEATAWGNSETQALERARKLCNLLNKQHEKANPVASN